MSPWLPRRLTGRFADKFISSLRSTYRNRGRYVSCSLNICKMYLISSLAASWCNQLLQNLSLFGSVCLSWCWIISLFPRWWGAFICNSSYTIQISFNKIYYLRLGGGLRRSSSEKVRAVGEQFATGGCGLLMLIIEGFRMPSRVKIVRWPPGVDTFEWVAVFVNCNCSRSDWWWWWWPLTMPGAIQIIVESLAIRSQVIKWGYAHVDSSPPPRSVVFRSSRESVVSHTTPNQ